MFRVHHSGNLTLPTTVVGMGFYVGQQLAYTTHISYTLTLTHTPYRIYFGGRVWDHKQQRRTYRPTEHTLKNAQTRSPNASDGSAQRVNNGNDLI